MTREEVQKELQAWASSRPNDPAIFDSFREVCLKDIAAHTKRAVIVYASDFLNPKFPPQAGNIGQMVLIHPKDIPAFRDLVDTVDGDEADLIIESPGGFAETAESVGDYLRSRFKHVRVIVPGFGEERGDNSGNGRRTNPT